MVQLIANKKLCPSATLTTTLIVATMVLYCAIVSIDSTQAKSATHFNIGSLYGNQFISAGNQDKQLVRARRALFSFAYAEKCPRGSFGTPGNCEPCGECFDYWDNEIAKLRNQTQALLSRVKLLLEIGTNGDYGKQFTEIEAKLDQIKHILDNQKLDEKMIRELARQLEALTKWLKKLETILDEMEKDETNTKKRIKVVKDALAEFGKLGNELNILIDELRINATIVQESNVQGAYEIVLNAQNRSREAEKQVQALRPLMMEQDQRRLQIELTLSSTAWRYNSSAQQNEAVLAELSRQIGELEAGVPGINQLVCASQSTVDTCDQLCGGALCQKCGGFSCAEAATTKASNALDLAKQAIKLLNEKYNQSLLNLAALDEIKNMSEDAVKQAKDVLAECDLQRSKFDKIGAELNSIMDGIDKFALIDGARPAEVRTLGNECLALSISLKPEQILDLARKINVTLASLTNIDKILAETAVDLNTAEELHRQADEVKQMADNILETVEAVLEMLRLAAIEQAKAAAAIAAASADIEGAESDLSEASVEIERWTKVIGELQILMKRIKNRLEELRKKYAQNELYVSQAKIAANEAAKLTAEAERVTDLLADKVREAEEKLAEKLRLNGELKDRVERFRNDALQLSADVAGKMKVLRELDDLFDEFAKRLNYYQDTVDDLHKQMNIYLKDIDAKALFHRECQA